jgi:hypothetical protein
MPRKKKPKYDLSSLNLNRTVGLEIEGYMKTNPRVVLQEGGIPNCEIKRDGSLRNYGWSDSQGMHGVEIVTQPLNTLAPLEEVFDRIISRGWSASGRASLHIHVDASDYNFRERLKMLHFAKRIENVMLLFVKNRRYNNRYCRLIPEPYGKLLTNSAFDNATSLQMVYEAWSLNHRTQQGRIYIDRYIWCNALSSHHRTIEFRMFHPIRSAEEGAKFAYLVHQLVNLVKNTSLEQLEFIASRIEQEKSIKHKAKLLLQALNVPYALPLLNQRATMALIESQPEEVAII